MEWLFEKTQTPDECKLFEVKPLEIDRSIFEYPRKNFEEERVRKIIQEAFAEVDKHAEKYSFPFYTFIPNKYWIGEKAIAELEAYAKTIGGEMADMVELAMEWAQRIFNGESWENICKVRNYSGTSVWYRIVRWRKGYYWRVGGFNASASNTGYRDYHSFNKISDAVPLVVIRK